MTAWLAGNDASAPLTLGGLELTSVPDALPDSLQRLDVTFNQLTRLPDALPSSLRELDISGNLLAHWPEALPDSLEQLDVGYNRLTRLPENITTQLLPTDIADMRYFGVSNVTERDLDAAEASIRAAGPNEMIDYLSIDWSPWESVLRRLEPSQYEEAKARLHEVTENEFEGRLAKRLKRSDEATLANDIDAQVQAGPSIMKEIRREIMGPLTRSFLETRNLMGLLQ